LQVFGVAALKNQLDLFRGIVDCFGRGQIVDQFGELAPARSLIIAVCLM
jgi:hypothetical protein